ncbi:GNAT family N-acetyltransferase [Massilia sp. R2A-15]|nr:GNAT family N-acetyltransferase [Massilia sp. R2A-15]
MVVIDTERLRLRLLTLDDAPFYLEVVNTPGFIKFIGDRGIRTVEVAREAISNGPIAMQESLGHSLYLVERKEDGAPIGMCGLIKRETLTHVDIGYAFLPQFGGKGYATEAAAGVLAYAPSIGIRRLLAITSPGNDASDAVLRRIGMRFEKLVYLTPEDTGTQLFSRDF